MDYLSEDETEALIMNLLRAMAPDPVSETDMAVAVKWANGIRIQAALLDLCLKGQSAVSVKDGQLFFHAVES